jgi:hypothetical protein
MAKIDPEEITGREKCTRQYALNVARNAKFLSRQQRASLSTAENAMRRRRDTNFEYIF